MAKIKLGERQKTALDLLNDPQIVELDFGGAAGGAKSWTVCLWMLKQCRDFKGIRIGLGRKELTRLKQTTIITMLREVHPIMGVKGHEFNYSENRGAISYINGSEILLFDLNRQPSDPDFDTLGSVNLTHVVIEEIGEIQKKAYDVFGSRKNRFLNKEYGIVGKTVTTQNPSQNFTRDLFYEPYKNLGDGDYQKWEIGEVEINGEMKTAYRAFVKSLPTDNPFLPTNYIETLKRLPPQERKRLYEGNWDYMDDDDMLFKPLLLDKASTSETEEGVKYIAVDPADKGKDKTIVTLIEEGIVTKQKRLNHNPKDPTPISEQLSLQLIEFAQREGMENKDARRIAIEGNGVGVGMRDFMKAKGWFITEYTATYQSRSQSYYDASVDMDSGALKILNSLDTITEVRKQLMAISYEFDEKLQPKILKKDKLKEILGHSPDEADSLVICNWIRRGGMVKKAGSIIF